ncbi:hypothetical protein N7450_002808 [Penicillium hetheringtonii]|uniref:Nuclear membrane fusion protein Kar5 n=1 Tax=Penicillium hetheringtonii TaxID=911720 RepID=A0AAD6GZ08_9EURO|nr:hypothetical protein N7450_002808 [Penicillium hetheringtonii]
MARFTTTQILLLLLMVQMPWAQADHLNTTPIIAGGSQMLHHLGSQAHKHNEIFNEAVIILDAMKSSPSCNRVAATRLVESCQSFGGKHTDDAQADEHEALDSIRSMYAARLAICELDGAGASVPAPCLPITVSPPATPKFRFSFVKKSQVLDSGSDLLPKEVIGNCLKALESRPQWWTSYSNNRQNAMVICQATRFEMEREELLDLHRAIVETSSKLHQGLQEALYNSALETSQHHTFLEEVRQLQMRLVEEIEGSASVTQSALHKLLRQVQAGLDRISTSNFDGTRAYNLQEIKHTAESAHSIQETLLEMQGEAISRSQELARLHKEDTLAYRNVASLIQSSLQSIVDKDVARLSQRMMTFDASLEWLNSRLVLILEQENKMTQSYNRANDLQQAQQSQAKALAAQSRKQEEIRYKTQISQALLDKVTTTTANLHSMMDEATVKFKRTPGLHSGGISTWTLCLLLFILIGVQNAKMAVALFFLIFGEQVLCG